MSSDQATKNRGNVEDVFESIANPREHFNGSYERAFDELFWRSVEMLFTKGRLEKATTRELLSIAGTAIDRIQDLQLSGASANEQEREIWKQRHLWATTELQRLMKDFGLTRDEAIAKIESGAPRFREFLEASRFVQSSDKVQ